jgi:polysaccharide deacetylase family protein (PEP-CTERM system associated)
MKNALTVDLEDWFCVYNMSRIIKREDWNKCDLRVSKNTARLLDVFERHQTKATFFVLGWVADRLPGLVQEIEKKGHEIASHGYSHTLLNELGPESFEKDLAKALTITQRCSSGPVVGFRAPSFSITEETKWALEILSAHGIRYDSSVVPTSFHPDYGVKGSLLSVYPIHSRLLEVPISSIRVLGTNIPFSGGGYFRLFPYWLTKFFIRKCHREGRPVVFYIHPWEIDPDQPRLKLPRTKRFRHYHNLDKTLDRLEKLLQDFEFTTIREILNI